MAGARRTQTSFTTFYSHPRPSDLGVAAFTKRPMDITSSLAKLPHVEKVESYVALSATLTASHHAPNQLLPFVSVVGSTTGEFLNQDIFTVTSGHLANPRRSDQIEVSQSAALLLKLRLGQKVTLNFAANSACEAAYRPSATVVGIGLLNSQVVQDDVERYPTYIVVTPALTRDVPSGDLATRWYQLNLAGGSQYVPSVENDVFSRVPAYLVFRAASVYASEAQLAIKPEATALWVFGLIALLAALVLAIQALARQLHAREHDVQILRSLGADPSMTVGDGLINAFGAVVLGSVLAVAICVALSPLFPVGPARPVFPSAGVAIDWTVVGIGLVVLIGVLGAWSLLIAYRSAPHRIAKRVTTAREGSAITAAAVRAGLAPSAVVGLRFALERSVGRNAISVRSALYGAVVAVTIVATTLTFGASLSALTSHPALYGWNFDYALDSSAGYGPIPPKAQAMLTHDPNVAAWTGVTFFTMQIDGVEEPVLFADAPAAFSSPIVSGHALSAANQIVLGRATLAELHKQVGEHVLVSYGTPELSVRKSLIIVGISTLPTIGISEGLHTSMGTGALLPNAAFPQLSEQGYPTECNGPNMALVRIRPGVSGSKVRVSLQHISAATDREFENANNNCSLVMSTLGVQRPGQLRDYATTSDSSPLLLAAGLAGGAAVALGFALFASVRARRRELALLKTLGFTRRQLGVAIVWQASVAGASGILLGIPLGIALGRWLWTLFASEIYAVPSPAVPIGELVLVAVGTLILANAVAALPGIRAARTPTAIVLRSE